VIVVALILAALIIALVNELQANGRSLTDYAVILIALALLWGRL
jgi:drug/metabolite transporter superfamily protein YnfA